MRILHLSDIHFGQEKKGQRVRHDDVRKRLGVDLAEILGQDKIVDLILINGDIAFSGKTEEYQRAVAWLDELADIGRCPATSILAVPGNHDVDLDLISRAAKQVHLHLRACKPETVKETLHEYTSEADEVNALTPKLRSYIDFARGYSSEHESKEAPRWIKYREFPSGHKLRVVGLSSVQVSDLNDQPHRMLLGDKQYIFPEDRSAITLVMVHHPMSWLMDRVDATYYIHNRSEVLLTGHEHLAELNKVTSLAGLERIEIFAGAITSTESDSAYRYSYNVLEFDVEPDADEQLRLTVWPRVWSGDKPCFVADVGKTGGPDFRTISLKCGLDRTIETGKPKDDQVKVMTVDPVSEDVLGFNLLKHFFWHYLTWQQRITVLVKSEVLPDTVEIRLPQTLELDALNRARQSKKLATIWDLTMAFIPTEKRKANPFAGDPK